MLKRAIKKHTPRLYLSLKRAYYYIINLLYVQRSYSLEGEDLVLAKLLDFKSTGYYVDIGAHHPVQFSNTNFFYKMGWHGINIDAMPGSMKIFNSKRKRDINLEMPITASPQELSYYVFEAGAYNTFSKELAEKNAQHSTLLKKIVLKTQTLASVLDQYVSAGQEIDFFSIDVEGYDLEVLEANDWKKYRPKFVLVEDHGFDLETPTVSPIYNYLHSQDYKLAAKTDNTVFYRANK